jgi:hypothetical protein
MTAKTLYDTLKRLDALTRLSPDAVQKVMGIGLGRDDLHSDAILTVYRLLNPSTEWRDVELRLSCRDEKRALLIFKPVSPDILLDTINAHLGRNHKLVPPDPRSGEEGTPYYEYRCSYGVLRLSFRNAQQFYLVDTVVLDRFQ